MHDHWMSHNFLTLNATKCKQMVIARSRTHQCLQLYLASQPLECVQSYKYLGVIITSNPYILVRTYTVHLQQEGAHGKTGNWKLKRTRKRRAETETPKQLSHRACS